MTYLWLLVLWHMLPSAASTLLPPSQCYLAVPTNYSSLVPPSTRLANGTYLPAKVNINITVFHVSRADDFDQTIEVTFSTTTSWVDPRLMAKDGMKGKAGWETDVNTTRLYLFFSGFTERLRRPSGPRLLQGALLAARHHAPSRQGVGLCGKL